MCRDLGEEIPWWERFDAYHTGMENYLSDMMEHFWNPNDYDLSSGFPTDPADLNYAIHEFVSMLPPGFIANDFYSAIDALVIGGGSVGIAAEATIVDEIFENAVQLYQDVQNLYNSAQETHNYMENEFVQDQIGYGYDF